MIDHNKANNKIHTRTGLIIIFFVLALIFAISLILNNQYQNKIKNSADDTDILLPNSYKPLPTNTIENSE